MQLQEAIGESVAMYCVTAAFRTMSNRKTYAIFITKEHKLTQKAMFPIWCNFS